MLPIWFGDLHIAMPNNTGAPLPLGIGSYVQGISGTVLSQVLYTASPSFPAAKSWGNVQPLRSQMCFVMFYLLHPYSGHLLFFQGSAIQYFFFGQFFLTSHYQCGEVSVLTFFLVEVPTLCYACPCYTVLPVSPGSAITVITCYYLFSWERDPS